MNIYCWVDRRDGRNAVKKGFWFGRQPRSGDREKLGLCVVRAEREFLLWWRDGPGSNHRSGGQAAQAGADTGNYGAVG